MNRNKSFLIIILLFLISLVPLYTVLWRAIKTKFSNPSPMHNNLPSLTFIREPAVAGSFYPENLVELSTKIDDFLKQAPLISAEGKLQILFVPHAGIDYSGAVVSAGFKQVEGKKYAKVIILGVSHHQWFSHAAIFPKGVWKTPLGKVKIEETLTNKLKDDNLQITLDSAPHKDEHSIEIELIFLQKVLKNFKIVPILLSQANEALVSSLAEKISSNLDAETLLVISSDLSHYPSWEVANKVDREVVNAILSGKKEVFEQTLRKLEEQHYPNLDTCACGENPIKVGLKVAEILKITNFKLVKYENSGDITKTRDRVVGYAAIGAWNQSFLQNGEIDEKAQKEALAIARQTLEQYSSGQPPSLPSPTSPLLQKLLGAFVTLRKHDELRGCIGTFEPKEPLYQVIQKMAIAAADKDYRFPPVRKEELSEIKIEISVITPKTKIADWKKIELEKHGVVVQKGLRSGTFLPQVATETGWTKEEFLSQLCTQKAGLPPDCYKDPSVTLYTFEAQVFEER